MPGRVEVRERDLRRLVAALRDEADGAELKRDLVAGLRKAAEPVLVEQRGAILSMRSKGHVGAGLRQKVADRTRIHVRLSGQHPGVTIKAHKTGMVRKFWNAPKRLNAKGGWRHQVFGDADTWVTQVGKPEWFDRPTKRHRAEAIRAAAEALDNVAKRISRKTKG